MRIKFFPTKNELELLTSNYSRTMKLVLGSVLSAIAVLLQSAGVFTGIGYVFSMFATLPIVLATMISVQLGIMSYTLSILLLVIIQPSELIVFPFTTGLLGLGLGIGFKLFKHWLKVSIFSAVVLMAGIFLLLYGLKFPVLGPSIGSSIDIRVILGTLLFSLIYSWIWVLISVKASRFMRKVIVKDHVTSN